MAASSSAAVAVGQQLACLRLGSSASAVGISATQSGGGRSTAVAAALVAVPTKLDGYGASVSAACALSFSANAAGGSARSISLHVPKARGSGRYVSCDAAPDGAGGAEDNDAVVIIRAPSSEGSNLAAAAAAAVEANLGSTKGLVFYEDGTFEREEDIEADYARLYGAVVAKAVEVDFGDDDDDDGKSGKKGRGRRGDDDAKGGKRAIKDNFEERVLQIRRVTKVVKGGKQMSFRAIVVVGDKRGTVGVGTGKAKEIVAAVQKASKDARRHVTRVPLTKYLTFPHRAEGDFGAAKVMLRPAAPGSGIVAGGAVRVVLELSGAENALGKQLGGSKNPLNNARATIEGIKQMRQFKDVAKMRGVTMQHLWS
ncbi:hypothetical protein CBR_g50385 [Chara braunii]|uniref:Small ribosomal subunit protein uS5c n=1 Tax=Chara braunii TaxID=69332 RepID=A0A388M6I8_CHABU|nr:hypothetical protein CBR_g50385 [Chara braunii]|eukprot:GBG90204.1 hypothetical protein CBR_g50385 [Chara braunii]